MLHPTSYDESLGSKPHLDSGHEPTHTGFPQSLAFMPAGLEVVPGYELDKHTVQSEKEAAQAEPEVIGADTDKEILHPWVPIPLSPNVYQSLNSRKICGVNRTLFWAALASLILLVGLCTGLGVGLGSKKLPGDGQCDSGKRDANHVFYSNR